MPHTTEIATPSAGNDRKKQAGNDKEQGLCDSNHLTSIES